MKVIDRVPMFRTSTHYDKYIKWAKKNLIWMSDEDAEAAMSVVWRRRCENGRLEYTHFPFPWWNDYTKLMEKYPRGCFIPPHLESVQKIRQTTIEKYKGLLK